MIPVCKGVKIMESETVTMILIAAAIFIALAAPPVYAWVDRWLDRTVEKKDRQ